MGVGYKFDDEVTTNEINVSVDAFIFAIILTLMVIVSISFINVTNNTMYHNTWQQLKSYSDSLIQDSIRYNMATQSFEGFATESLNSNANLFNTAKCSFCNL